MNGAHVNRVFAFPKFPFATGFPAHPSWQNWEELSFAAGRDRQRNNGGLTIKIIEQMEISRWPWVKNCIRKASQPEFLAKSVV